MKKATYIRQGNGKSYNARVAEADGKMPLTHAVRVVAANLGITQASSRRLLKLVGPCEWHHVGMYARRIDYYDTNIDLYDVAYLDEADVMGTGDVAIIDMYRIVDAYVFNSAGKPVR